MIASTKMVLDRIRYNGEADAGEEITHPVMGSILGGEDVCRLIGREVIERLFGNAEIGRAHV